jgi:hypothetical protein
MSQPTVNHRSAFTMWEVFFLLLIVALIYAVLVPNFVGSHTSSASSCINNLRQIDGAKYQWALEHSVTNLDFVPTENQIMNYLGRGQMLRCPAGGIYSIGKLGEYPTCSLGTNITPSHVLPPLNH